VEDRVARVADRVARVAEGPAEEQVVRVAKGPVEDRVARVADRMESQALPEPLKPEASARKIALKAGAWRMEWNWREPR
jgi:hypothetical protein